MSMHVIAGKYKGRKILGQKEGLRPTTAIVKASLFNIIGNSIKDKKFVDIFAGTGAVGVEAASRGASEITFVELNPKAASLIRKNIENIGFKGQVVRRDAFKFLASSMTTFDYIFLSPPFDTIHWHKLLRAIENSPLIGPETLVIVQHPKMVGVESFKLEKVDERKYGLNKLTFFKKLVSEEEE